MSKKDYVKFADIISRVRADGGDEDTLTMLAVRLASVLAADNPRFDRDRFFRAAGIE